jgi:hypothetical protein
MEYCAFSIGSRYPPVIPIAALLKGEALPLYLAGG